MEKFNFIIMSHVSFHDLLSQVADLGINRIQSKIAKIWTALLLLEWHLRHDLFGKNVIFTSCEIIFIS